MAATEGRDSPGADTWLDGLEALGRPFEIAAIAVIWLLVLLAPFTSLPPHDLGWQLKAGEIITRTGQIPRVDTLSWTARGEPWIVHEWLVCVLFHQLYTRLGLMALVALKVGLLWLVFYAVYRLALRYSGDRLASSLGALLAAYAGRIFWDVRPQLVTYLLLVAWLIVIDRWREWAAGSTDAIAGQSDDADLSGARPVGLNPLWLLPPLTLLWANCHGGFIVGPLALGICLAAEAVARLAYRLNGSTVRPVGPTTEQLRLGWIVLAACVGCSLINPYGYQLWLYPLKLASHPKVMGLITEWFWPNFKDAAYYCYEALILITGALLALAWRDEARIPGKLGAAIADLLLLAGALHLSLSAVRHVAIFGLLAGPICAKYAAHAVRQVRRVRQVRQKDPRTSGLAGSHKAARALCAAGLIVLLTPGAVSMARGIPWRGLTGFTFRAGYFPEAAIHRLKTAGLPGPIWNEYKWGGHLIWMLPDYPVFIDGRAEVYYSRAFDDFYDVHKLLPGWKAILDRREVNLVLADPYQGVSRALDLSPEWSLFFSDGGSRLYVRRSALIRPALPAPPSAKPDKSRRRTGHRPVDMSTGD